MRRGIICLTIMYTGVSFNIVPACLPALRFTASPGMGRRSTIPSSGAFAQGYPMSPSVASRGSARGRTEGFSERFGGEWRLLTRIGRQASWRILVCQVSLKLWVSGHEYTARISRWESGSVTVLSSQCGRCGGLNEGRSAEGMAAVKRSEADIATCTLEA